jgi:hypothetical protein
MRAITERPCARRARRRGLSPPEAWARWLGEQPASRQERLALCGPYRAERMRDHPFSTLVNNVRHDGPGVLEPNGWVGTQWFTAWTYLR